MIAGDRSVLLDTASTDQASIGRQFTALQFMFWMAVLGIVAAEVERPALSGATFTGWLAVTAIGWGVRMLLFQRVHRASESQIADSLVLRLLPLAIVAIACAYWIWTIVLMLQPQLTMKTLFVSVGFLATTIAMTAMWRTSRLGVIGYNACLWGTLAASMYLRGTAGLPTLIVLLVMVAGVLLLFVVDKDEQLRRLAGNAKALEISGEQLARSNEALNAILSTVKSELQARSQLFAETSHDLRNRLHSAKLALLQSGGAWAGGDPASSLEKAGREFASLERLMEGTLDYAQLEAGNARVTIAPVALQSVFQAVGSAFDADAIEAGRVIRVRPTTIHLHTDALMLERMLGNLVSNALQHATGRVLVGARRRQGGVCIEVWDQGPGIPDADLAEVFQPLTRARRSRRAGAQSPYADPQPLARDIGAGLGLAIVKRLAGLLDCQVSAASRPRRGTVMRIHVPASSVDSIPRIGLRR